MRLPSRFVTALVGLAVAGCATRAVDVAPLPADPAEFAAWDCARIDDEADAVQQRAADVAYAVDEIVGNNILALGVGLSVFWPALVAMRPNGHEAEQLGRLRGRYEALRSAAAARGCPPPAAELAPEQVAALPVAPGERLVYEQRTSARGAAGEWVLRLQALRRDEFEFRVERPGGFQPWRQDRAGNVVAAPAGAVVWSRLLRRELALGDVLGGDIAIAGDPLANARVRGQVVAIGPQTVAGRRLDVAVVELFGDARNAETSSRLEGAIVVDRASGLLVRLELRSATPGFRLERRLVEVRPAQP